MITSTVTTNFERKVVKLWLDKGGKEKAVVVETDSTMGLMLLHNMKVGST